MNTLSIEQIRRTVRPMLAGRVSTRHMPRMRQCDTCGHLIQHPLLYCTECPGKYGEPITWLTRLRMLDAQDLTAPCGWRVFADTLFIELGLQPSSSPRRVVLTKLVIDICQEQVAASSA